MKFNFLKRAFTFLGLLLLAQSALSLETTVPEPFQGYDPESKYTINYDDLTALLRTVVVDTGRSNREKAAPSQAATGTRMKVSVKRLTVNEANRFYYETFEDNEEGRKLLQGIQESLQLVPDGAPLKYFSRDEQLAYWLNLYNVTVLNQIIDIYPKSNLKKYLSGGKSIFGKKILTVAGVPLSLDDIQFTILRQNYDNDPLIIYGLYQGNIGGPNIRRSAYTGKDVYRALKNNAMEFINSNRGTYSQDERVFEVSVLYDRNRVYFPDFNADLKSHLLTFLEEPERSELQAASTLKPDIDDWSVADLTGSYRNLGASFADSRAALLDSVRSTMVNTNEGEGSGTLGTAAGQGSATLTAAAQTLARFEPELIMKLKEINLKREAVNAANATVTMEELGEAPVKDASKKDDDKDQEKDQQ
jgi:hypothetical protein